MMRLLARVLLVLLSLVGPLTFLHAADAFLSPLDQAAVATTSTTPLPTPISRAASGLYDPAQLSSRRIGNSFASVAGSTRFLVSDQCAILYDVPLSRGVVYGFTAQTIAASSTPVNLYIFIIRPTPTTYQNRLGFIVQADYQVTVPASTSPTGFLFFVDGEQGVDTQNGDLMFVCGDSLLDYTTQSSIRNVVFPTPSGGIPIAFTIPSNSRTSTAKFDFQAMIWEGVTLDQIDSTALTNYLTVQKAAAGDVRNSGGILIPDPDSVSTSDSGSTGSAKDTVIVVLGIMGGVACFSVALMYLRRCWMYHRAIRAASVAPAGAAAARGPPPPSNNVLVYQPAPGEAVAIGVHPQSEPWQPKPPPLFDVASGGWTNPSSKIIQPTSEIELQRMFPHAVYTYKQAEDGGDVSPSAPPAYEEVFQPQPPQADELNLNVPQIPLVDDPDDAPPSFRAFPSRIYAPVSLDDGESHDAAAASSGVQVHSVYIPSSNSTPNFHDDEEEEKAQ
jgi:hypothetical protein